MIFFEHRQNSLVDLKRVNKKHGVEIDLRTDLHQKGKIHLSHDPWAEGDDISAWLQEFVQLNISGPVILNTKEDGLEERLIQIFATHPQIDFFFLDTAFPTFIKFFRKGLGHKFFFRVSKYEDFENSLKFKESVKWLWMDCFDAEPLMKSIFVEAKKHFKLCLVSPDLQGGTSHDFARFHEVAKFCDGICTKAPDLWLAQLNGS